MSIIGLFMNALLASLLLLTLIGMANWAPSTIPPPGRRVASACPLGATGSASVTRA